MMHLMMCGFPRLSAPAELLCSAHRVPAPLYKYNGTEGPQTFGAALNYCNFNCETVSEDYLAGV